MYSSRLSLWEHTGSNRGPSACKADALNQLSYAPSISNNRSAWTIELLLLIDF